VQIQLSRYVAIPLVAILVSTVVFWLKPAQFVEDRNPEGTELADHVPSVEQPQGIQTNQPDRLRDEGRNLLEYEDDWCSRRDLSKAGRAVYWMKLREWRRTIGYFKEVDSVAYEGYGSETLRRLGTQGDLLALDTLYQRLSENPDSVDEANELLLPAVAFGSTKAAITLGLIHRLNADRNEDSTFVDEDLYRIMAFYEIAIMSGDVFGADEGLTFLHGIGRELDASERSKVNELADQIVANLQEQYGVAERTPYPKSVADFNRRHIKRILTESDYDGWASTYLVDNQVCSIREAKSVVAENR